MTSRLLLFLLTWPTLGFFLGTLTLMGPVRWLTSFARARQWSQATEDLMVRALLLVLVVATAVVAWRLVGWAFATADRRWRVMVPSVSLLLAMGALGLWMNPSVMSGAAMFPTSRDTARFVFGAYPTRESLERLKDEGYAGVITLLHPAVVPFEPKLLADERRAATAAGITLIEAPMLPWVSGNESSLAAIESLAKQPGGRYYIHCYLGKDRVNVVRRMLETVSTVSMGSTPDIGTPRRLTERSTFERGPIVDLGDSVFVIPFPTDEEWFGYMVSGWVKSVVSLLDDRDKENVPWIARERQVVTGYNLRVHTFPVGVAPAADNMQEIVTKVAALPRPVAVHGFLVPSMQTDAFIAAWRAAKSAPRRPAK